MTLQICILGSLIALKRARDGIIGILLVNVTNAVILDNEINRTLRDGEGLLLNSSKQCQVQGNLISNFFRGITLYSCENVPIENNEIFENTNGILNWRSPDCTISGNIIKNNTYGLNFHTANETNIFENNITENDYGVWLENSFKNKFYQNYFVDNINQAHIESNSENYWNETYPIGGNYWDDFETIYPTVEDIYDGEYPQSTGGGTIISGMINTKSTRTT